MTVRKIFKQRAMVWSFWIALCDPLSSFRAQHCKEVCGERRTRSINRRINNFYSRLQLLEDALCSPQTTLYERSAQISLRPFLFFLSKSRLPRVTITAL